MKKINNDEEKFPKRDPWWRITANDLEGCIVVLFLMFILIILSLFLIVMILSELHIINV